MDSEKTPEEKLVDELVGEKNLYYNISKKLGEDKAAETELYDIVTEAWKNGASVDEIQRVYDENLKRLFWGKYKLRLIMVTIVIIGLAVGGIYSIFFMEYTYTDFNEFEIDGVSFNIPSDYKLSATGETGDAFFNKYFTEYTVSSGTGSGTRRTTERTIFIEAYVYKTKSVQEVVSSISSEGWDAKNDSYGSYSGYKLERFGHDGGWFIFEKDGKTVAIYYERKAIGQNMEKIIS